MLQVVSFGMACNYSSVSGGTADHPPVLISLRLNLGPRPDRSTSASDSLAILRRDEELSSEAA